MSATGTRVSTTGVVSITSVTTTVRVPKVSLEKTVRPMWMSALPTPVATPYGIVRTTSMLSSASADQDTKVRFQK